MTYNEEPYLPSAEAQNNSQEPQENINGDSFPKRFIFLLVFSIFAIITLLAMIVAGIAHNILSANYDNGLSEPNVTLSAKATISVYYEVLCADSKAFVSNQLVPVQKKYREHVNIRFVPFGKASFVKRDNNQYQVYKKLCINLSKIFSIVKIYAIFFSIFQFYCQHGDEECHGNKLHACLIEAYDSNDDQSKLTSVIACSLNKYKYSNPTINSITRTTEECRMQYFPGEEFAPLLCSNSTELLVIILLYFFKVINKSKLFAEGFGQYGLPSGEKTNVD